MQWIERHRLEMVVGKSSEDAIQQLRTLRGKNKKALRSELDGWLEGSDKVEIESIEFMDYHGYW